MHSEHDNFLTPFDQDESNAAAEWRERLRRIYFDSRRLLAKWWWIILLSLTAGIGWQAYKEMQREPVYISNAKMMVSGRFSLPDNVYREEFSNFFGTQISLMTSARVQEKAKERVLMFQPDIPQSWVRLSVSQRPDTSIFQLQVEGGEPLFTQKFLDAVMEEYQSFRSEMRSETTETTLLAVTEQLYRLEEEIENQENTVVDFQKENNLVFLKEQDSSAGSYLARLTTQQAELKTRLLMLENLEPEMVGVFSTELTDLIKPENVSLLTSTRQELSQLRAELEEFSLYLKPKHPKIIKLNLDIERASNLMDIIRRQAVQSLDESKEQLATQIRNLDAVIEQWEIQALSISRKTAEFDRLQYRLERSRETYQQLLDSMQAIQSNQNITQETVGVLANASSASVRRPDVVKKATEGAVIGLFFGIGIIAGIAFLDVRVRASDELAKNFDFPILGIIPEEEPNAQGQVDLLQTKDRRHHFAEACRSLRSSILLHDSASESPCPTTILLTSASPNEGKSTISSNLAIALSLTGKGVLLIDADMRQGGIHEQFELDGKSGLSDLLSDDRDFSDFVQPTSYQGLDFISNGSRFSNAGELLLTNKIDQFIEWAKQHYKFIIFDAPPVLAVHDTIELSNRVDSMLFVARANQTSIRQVRASFDRLSSRASKTLGFVFNCAPVDGVDYYYYYRDYDEYHQLPNDAKA